jgi:hypothetical protein
MDRGAGLGGVDIDLANEVSEVLPLRATGECFRGCFRARSALWCTDRAVYLGGRPKVRVPLMTISGLVEAGCVARLVTDAGQQYTLTFGYEVNGPNRQAQAEAGRFVSLIRPGPPPVSRPEQPSSRQPVPAFEWPPETAHWRPTDPSSR